MEVLESLRRGVRLLLSSLFVLEVKHGLVLVGHLLSRARLVLTEIAV